MTDSELRIAIVHDKLWQFGGGERVALAMRDVWPRADFFTSTFDPALVDDVGFGDVHATFLQRVPWLSVTNGYLLPFYDLAFRRLDLSGYDLVVSSSAMFGKSVRPPAGTPHLCYCHTPTRFLWDLRDSIVAELPRAAPVRWTVGAMAHWLRRVDRRAAQRVTRFVANSTHVAKRIERHYGRRASVIPPPVAVERYDREFEARDHVLVVARLFPYKRVDLVIEACNALGLPLVVIGDGTDRSRLERIAGPTVSFRGWVPEAEKEELIGSARVLVAPQVEDFGIATVEAIAAGTPVLSLRAGGALDIVKEGVNGAFFDEQSAEAVRAALAAFDEKAFDVTRMRRSVQGFAGARFGAALRACAADLVAEAAVDAPQSSPRDAR